MFNKAAGADASGTRYRDLQSIVSDLTQGNTDFIVMDVPVAAEKIKSGKLRALRLLERNAARHSRKFRLWRRSVSKGLNRSINGGRYLRPRPHHL